MKDPVDRPGAATVAEDARIAAMLEHPTLAVAVIERGRIRRANAAWNALFVVPTDISVESHLITLFPSPNSADRFERALSADVGGDDARRAGRVEHMLLRRDGVPFMAEIVVQATQGSERSGLSGDAVWQVRDITAERELRRELRELEEYYRVLSTYQWDLTFVIDKRDCVSFASPSVETALGYRPNAILGEPFSSLLATSGAVGAMQWLRNSRTQAAAPRDSHRLRVRHQNGEQRVLSCRLRNCLDVPRLSGLLINARDVTEEVLEEEQSKAALERSVRLRDRLFELATAITGYFDDRLALLLQTVCDDLAVSGASFWQLDDDSDVLRCTHAHVARESAVSGVVDRLGQTFDSAGSPAYARQLQTQRPIIVADVRDDESIGPGHRELLVEAGVGAFLDFPVAMEGRLAGILSVAHASLARKWMTEEIDFAAGISLLIASALEGRQREEIVEQIEHMSLRDGLTSLANRSHGLSELELRIAEAQITGGQLAAALVDVDLFREVNNGFGHAMGDALLVAVAAMLVEIAGPDAFVARMGTDAFFVVRPEAGVGDADPLFQRILERIGGENVVEGIEQRVSASIGVARYPFDGADAEALLSATDIALFEAKARGGNQIFAFNGGLAEKGRLQRELDAEIQDALVRSEFCMFYQPQIDIATEAIVGMEALLRWQHPARGLLLPEAFIASALHRGMVDTLTRWVLTQVCEQIVAWRRAGLSVEVPVSVNMTDRQFGDRRLPAVVASALMKSALPARMLMLEVTENCLGIDDPSTARVVKELSRLGVGLAISDFGFDGASLASLRRTPVAQIKIERSCVQGLPGDPIAGVVVDAIVALAASLECQVIAEGVETREQRDDLAKRGCHAGQGFFFGAPLSAQELQDFLGTRKASTTH